MRNYQKTSCRALTQQEPSLLTDRVFWISDGDRQRIAERGGRIVKGDRMLPKVGSSLLAVPDEAQHRPNVGEDTERRICLTGCA